MRTGCVAVLETLDIMLRNSPEEVRAACSPRLLALLLTLRCRWRAAWWTLQDTTRRSRTRCVPFARAGVSTSLRQAPFLQSTEAFVNDTMRAVCGSLSLAQYRSVRSFWGEQLWQEDPVPDYTQSRPVEPRLAELVGWHC